MSQQNFVSYDDATSIVTEVASKIAGKQDVLSFDNFPTQNSDNPVKSGGVYTALASKANTSDIGTAAAKNFTTSVTSGSNDLVTSGAVYTAIDNLPEPMVFKGSLGTGGTITALPVNGTATVGDTYKVITAGTYASKAAKVGDTFICLTKTSSANTWELIPSGDEPSGTVTSVTLKATSPIAIDSSSAITTSGTRTLSHANSGATAGSYGDSGNQTPGYGSTFKVPYVTVNATGHVTAISEHTVKIPASDNTNTTYTFTNGTNQFTVTPSGGSAQTVTVTPSFTVTTGDANGQVKVNGTNASVKGLGTAAYTASTAYAAASHTHNYAGSSSAGGAANSLANFKVTNNTNLGIDNPGSNAIGYVSGLTKASWNYQQTDGALYTQRYDDKWMVEILQDYRTGQLSVRGKNNGTWQGWRNILDSSNYASYITPAGIGAAASADLGSAAYTNSNNYRKVNSAGEYTCSGNGQNWYYRIATITIPGSYVNGPILFHLGGRGYPQTNLIIRFASVSGTDPSLELITSDIYQGYYIRKTATSTWEVIGRYNEQWGRADLYYIENYSVNIAINMTNIGTSLPDGCMQASKTFPNTTYTASTTSIGSASAGTAIAADDITSWSAGTVPSLTITSTACDDITAWSAGTMTSASYSKGVLTITNGSAPSLSYTARSVGSASGWSAGTAPSLSYTARSIPNISVSSKTVVTGITAG